MAEKKWILDPTHSEVQFKIKHLMITNVTGSFNIFSASVETDNEDFTRATISFTADVASIDTGNAQRDAHLQSADFFDADKYPHIKFVATKYEKIDNDGSYELYGDLTIKEVTRNIELSVEFGGVVTDPYGQTKAGFTLNGKINRKDFGLSYNAALETGGVLLGEEVKLNIELQFVKQ